MPASAERHTPLLVAFGHGSRRGAHHAEEQGSGMDDGARTSLLTSEVLGRKPGTDGHDEAVWAEGTAPGQEEQWALQQLTYCPGTSPGPGRAEPPGFATFLSKLN